jgi:hypothetical protein
MVNWVKFPDYTDFCFKTYSYAGKIADLSCHTVFGWPDQVPGGTITDEFTIRNIGDENSLLNWEVQSCPEWGNWTFDPSSGVDLEPEDGPLSVTVNVDVPDEQNTDFSGEIILVNSNNLEDTATIPVSMSTEKAKGFHMFDHLPWFVQWVIEHFLF